MKNKGHKSSNIFQTLKGSGAWQSKDGSKPMIKDVGIKSPLNMNQSLGKHYLSKGTDGNSPLNLATIAGGYLAAKAVKKGAELVGKAKQAYSDYKSGQKSRVESETKKKNQSDNQTKLNNASGKKMKDLAHGSQERYDEYERRKWKHDETSKVKKKEDKPAETTTTTPPVEKPTAKEVAVKTDNVSKAKANVQSEREKKVTAKADLAKAGGKAKKAARLEKRAARIAKRKEKGTGVGNLIRKGVAAVKGKKGAAKNAAVAAQVAANEEKKNSAAAMKKSPAKLAAAAAKAGAKAGAKAAKKSPAKKSLVGKQGNLPDHLVAKIKAAPGKMKYKK